MFQAKEQDKTTEDKTTRQKRAKYKRSPIFFINISKKSHK